MHNRGTSISTTVKFGPQRDMIIPDSWVNANESSLNKRCNNMVDNGAPVAVSIEYLKLIKASNNKVIMQFLIYLIRKTTILLTLSIPPGL
jgi:hypothetical protein